MSSSVNLHLTQNELKKQHYTGDARSVLLLRPDHLGDMVLFSGALKYFRSLYPKAKISLCVQEYVRDFVVNCPYIDHVFPWEELERSLVNFPLLGGICKMRGGWRLQQFLRMVARNFLKRRYAADLVILPLRSPFEAHHRVATLIPCRWRFGLFGDGANIAPEAEEIFRNAYCLKIKTEAKDFTHELETNRRILEFLGCKVTKQDIWPETWESDADIDHARAILTAPDSNLQIVAVSPGANLPLGKLLPPDWYGEVFREFPGQYVKVVVFGSPNEVGLCEKVCAAITKQKTVSSVESYAGLTRIGSLVECLRRCDCLLSVDNACLHLGTAVGAKTVGIVGGGHWGRFFPWGRDSRNIVLTKKMPCFHCDWRCRYDRFRCIQEVSPIDAREHICRHLSFSI